MPKRRIGRKLLFVFFSICAASSLLAEDAPDGKSLAWIRFDQGPETYDGTPYFWLGRTQIDLTMEAKPTAGLSLDLLWGSKNDSRDAQVVVNGETQIIEGGGYDGFRWKRVLLPNDLKGENLQVSIRQANGKAAFLAEVRLVEPTGKRNDAEVARLAVSKTVLNTAVITIAQPPSLPARPAPPLPTDPLDRSAEIAGFTISKVQRWLHDVALQKIEPDTGLYHPDGNFNYQDAWADCYPFLVWAAWLTDLEALNGPVRDALHAEIKHCPKGFFTDPENTFGGSEYVKDGLIAIVEITGRDEWFDRMRAVQDEIWANPTIDTPYGKIPSTNIEVNGEQIQALTRMYTMTGEKKYLEYAERLADYYLLSGDFVPTRLRDHGCEIIGGLGLLLAVESVHRPDKAKQYLPHMKKMLDTVLEKGTNEDGIMYDTLGKPGSRLSDGWGYNYVAYLCYDWVADKPVYRAQMERTLRNLAKPAYQNRPWEGTSIDGFADSVEGGLYILNRLPVPEGLAWADREVGANIAYRHDENQLWGTMKLQSNGVRTAIIHALMHTRGTIARPWQQGLKLGAIDRDSGIEIVLKSDKPYEGKLVFDLPRHRDYIGFRKDWPRMNTIPEWFTVDQEKNYTVEHDSAKKTYTGAQLHDGLPVSLKAEGKQVLRVQEAAGR
ncbi:MAG: hypothetical protein GY903_10265 [Fuerstiella sp.]|nr:hypothetical protein [Fuerstiella sp.]MCP4854861.1 hypothetical protein [Fuerstiella sp.]